MKGLISFIIAVLPILSFGQINFKKGLDPYLFQIEVAPGYYESNATLRIPFNPSTSATFVSVTNFSDSIASNSQFIGLSNNINVDRRSSINLEAGYLFKFQDDLNFDITARVGYHYLINRNLYSGVALMGSIPREIKSSFAPSLQVLIGVKLPKEVNPRGLVNSKRNKPEYQAFALFGSHHSILQLNRYSTTTSPLGIELKVATDLGYIFRHPSAMDWQSLGVSYRLNIDDYISIHPSIGIIGHIHNLNIPAGIIAGASAQIDITNDIIAKIEIQQSSKPYIRDRIQPWVFAGVGLKL